MRRGIWTDITGNSSICERRTDSLSDHVFHSFAAAKTYFGLSGMDVNIYLLKRHLNEKKCYRIDAVREHRAIALGHARRYRLVPNESLIDKEVLRVACGASLTRGRNKARNPSNVFAAAIDR